MTNDADHTGGGEWFVVHEPTSQIVGTVSSGKKPEFFRDSCTLHTLEELLADPRYFRMLKEYEWWKEARDA